jgi:undecaprenyl-diphosphatase
MSWDIQLFYFFNGVAGKSVFFDSCVVFFAEYYLYFVLAVFVLVLLKGLHYKIGVMAVLSALIARFGAVSLIRYFYHRPRPFIALPSVQHLFEKSSYAFPSGHATFVFALAAFIFFYNKKLAYFLFASGLIIGIARVVAGAHYPSDILGGIALGIGAGLIFQKISEFLKTTKNWHVGPLIILVSAAFFAISLFFKKMV